jgi:hypothetical protein
VPDARESLQNPAPQPPKPEGLVIALGRSAHFFATRPGLAERLEKVRVPVTLAPDQLFHPEPDTEYVVRLGKLRVSHFLEDGREVARAVLQAGGVFIIRHSQTHGDNPASDVYTLADIVLMALGETELWALPPGSISPES